MHTCSSKEKKLPFGKWFEREMQTVTQAFWKRLDWVLPLITKFLVGPAWFCVTMMFRQHASYQETPCPWRRLCVLALAVAEHRSTKGDLAGAVVARRLAPSRVRCTVLLSQPEGRWWWLQQRPWWRRQVRGRCLQVDKSNYVAPVPCLSFPLLFYRHLTRTIWYQMTGPTSTRCSKPMCTRQPIIPVHWINMTTGPRPPLEGPLPTADDGQILQDWITSYMNFFLIDFMDQILAQPLDVNIVQ